MHEKCTLADGWVDLEVLNLLHAGTEQARVTHTLTLAGRLQVDEVCFLDQAGASLDSARARPSARSRWKSASPYSGSRCLARLKYRCRS